MSEANAEASYYRVATFAERTSNTIKRKILTYGHGRLKVETEYLQPKKALRLCKQKVMKKGLPDGDWI